MQRWYLLSVSECYRGRNVRVFRLDREGTIAPLCQRAHNLLAQRADRIQESIVLASPPTYAEAPEE